MSSNFWNFRGYNPTNTDDAALAAKQAYDAHQASNMQGYRPLPNMQGYQPTYGGGQVDPGFKPATQPQLQQYEQNAELMNLKSEYEQNAARIAEIEKELATIAQNESKNLDDFDMQLAQNRAGIGDLGIAQMHLNRIDQRRAVAQGRVGNNAKDRAAAEDEIDRLYMMRAEASPAQLAYYDRAIKRKEDEYQNLYGKQYGGELVIPTGKQDSGSVATFQGYDDVLQQELVKNGNNGRLSKAQIDKLNGILDKLPAGEERNARKKALDAVVSNEKKSANDAEQKGKEKTAIAEVRKSVTGWDLKETGASKTVEAKNGLSVTVTRMSDGSIQYKCGSTKG